MTGLERQDFDTPTWRRLEAMLRIERDARINELIRPQTAIEPTERLRARIKLIDELLALSSKTAPVQPAAPVTRSHLSEE